MSNMTEIPDSNGMQVMCDVADLETGKEGDIVIRNITAPFWEECIRVLDDPAMRYCVCAVGTPGIGKTTSTLLRIRMLLKQGSTVAYLVPTVDLRAWYYEFIPQPDHSVVINLYPESTLIDKIASLENRLTFYIVDPGKTKDSCNRSDLFQPKLLIVKVNLASTDVMSLGVSGFPHLGIGRTTVCLNALFEREGCGIYS
jgi:hypothetical protein